MTDALREMVALATWRTDTIPPRDSAVLRAACDVYGAEPDGWPHELYEWASENALIAECACGKVVLAHELHGRDRRVCQDGPVFFETNTEALDAFDPPGTT